MDSDLIMQCLRDAVGEVNAQRPADQHLAPDPSLALTGPDGLGSLGMLTLVVAAESNLRSAGVSVDLAASLMDGSPPPETLADLADRVRILGG